MTEYVHVRRPGHFGTTWELEDYLGLRDVFGYHEAQLISARAARFPQSDTPSARDAAGPAYSNPRGPAACCAPGSVARTPEPGARP